MSLYKEEAMNKFPQIHNTLCFIISLIPLSLVIGIAITELLIFTSIVFYLFLNYQGLGVKYYKKKIFLFFLLFNFYLIFSSLFSETVINSIRNSLFYFRFGFLVIIIWYLLENFEKFKIIFFKIITITFLIVIFFTLFQIFILQSNESMSRITGLFGSEQIQGSFILRSVPIFVILYLYNQKNLNKNFKYIFLFILLFSLILILLSGERSSVFLAFIGIFLTFFFFKFNFKKILVFLFFTLLTFGLTLSLNPASNERLLNKTFKQFFFTFDSAGKTVKKKLHFFSEGHQDHFQAGILMFQKNFIKGVGVRNYRNECKKDIYKEVGKHYCTTHPHNTYIQILSETGLIGFIFFISFLIFIFFNIKDYIKIHYNTGDKVNKPLGMCFVIILVNFFPIVPTGSFFNNWLSFMYFLPIGFLLYELDANKNSK